jgi:hypothetical protein
VKPDLRFNCVLVTREGSCLHDDFVSFSGGPVKRYHHKVQIDTQSVHYHYLVRKRPNEPGGSLGQEFVVVHPGLFSPEMAFHGVLSPMIQFCVNGVSDCDWLKSERVSAEIEHRLAMVLWKYKLLPEGSQRIFLIQFLGKIK